MIIGNCTQARGLELIGLQRHVRGAEGYGLGLDLLDAATGADGLIIQTVAGLGLVGICPLRINGIREGRARAGNIGGVHPPGEHNGGRSHHHALYTCKAHSLLLSTYMKICEIDRLQRGCTDAWQSLHDSIVTIT